MTWEIVPRYRVWPWGHTASMLAVGLGWPTRVAWLSVLWKNAGCLLHSLLGTWHSYAQHGEASQGERTAKELPVCIQPALPIFLLLLLLPFFWRPQDKGYSAVGQGQHKSNGPLRTGS